MQSDLKGLFVQASERLTQAELLVRLRHNVREALVEKGIEIPHDASILFDDTTGRVCIIHGVHVWDGEAAEIAQETAHALFSEVVKTAVRIWPSPSSTFLKQKESRLASFFFWGFNGMVLTYWVLWFLRFVFSDNFREWYSTAKDSGDFGIFGLILFLLLPVVPLTAVLYRLKTIHTPENAVRKSTSFFKFELPALFSAYAVNMISIIIPLTAGLRIVGILLYITLLYVWFLSVHRISWSKPWVRILHFGLTTFSVVFVAYIALLTAVTWYLIFFEEVVVNFFEGMGDTLNDLFLDPLTLVPTLLILSGIALPLVVGWVLVKIGIRRYTTLFSSVYTLSPRLVRAIAFGSAPIFFVTLGLFSLQPSLGSYGDDLIYIAQEDLSYESLSARAVQLVDEKNALDSVLQYAVHASKYYMFSKSDFEGYWFRDTPITSYYLRIVAFPFIYNDDNKLSGDQRDVLLRGYERVFGYSFGYDPEKSIAPFKNVTLLSRDVHAETKGSDVLAEVTVTDSFTTFMREDQEVVYEFSLPTEAVITDLRLGPALEHHGQIAPRGAAQQLYTEEVRRTRDPALLEQIGPRQYRLRVYPVPGASNEAERRRRESVDGEVQRVQFSYIVMRTQEGIPLPQYSEAYNVLDNDVREETRVDGKEFAVAKNGAYIAFPLDIESVCKGSVLDFQVSSGDTAKLTLGEKSGLYVPACNTNARSELVASVYGKKILLLIDSSYEERNGELASVLDSLRGFPDTFFVNNTVEYRLVSDVSSQSKKITKASEVPRIEDNVFFGHGDLRNAFAGIRSGQADIVVIISGKGTLFKDAVRRNTSVTTGVETSLHQLSSVDVVALLPSEKVSAFPSSVEPLLSYAESFTVTDSMYSALFSTVSTGIYELHGSYWHMEVTQDSEYADVMPNTTMEWSEQALQLLAEHLVLANESRSVRKIQSRSPITVSSAFDSLYARAERLGIVTPLSSYIALVNASQQVRLNELSQRTDRYTSEQRFSVTQPNSFANPLGSDTFTRGSVSMSDNATMAPAPMAPGMSLTKESSVAPRSSGSETSGEQEGTNTARFLVVSFVVLLLGGASFTVIRVLRRQKVREV
jgi:hypothetical protein